MFPFTESTAYHLTPRGWRMGDTKREGSPSLFRPAPIDQVLSLLCTTVIDSEGYRCRSSQEIWRSRNVQHLLSLLIMYGPAPDNWSN
jgi:hypothetical protein